MNQVCFTIKLQQRLHAHKMTEIKQTLNQKEKTGETRTEAN